MGKFSWDIRHYPDLAAYEAALLPFEKPAWIKGVVLHHTWKPVVADWQGLKTMQFLGEFYEQKGWQSGPHLFLVAGSERPFANGLWAGTPLSDPGVHAGPCNADSIGVEVVGNYDTEGWPAPVATLVYGVLLLLMRWGDIPPARVRGHRECLDNKSCPGRMINMGSVRAALSTRIVPRYRLPRVAVYERPDTASPFVGYLNSYTEYGVREIKNGWGKLGDVSMTGWVPLDRLERVS